jgi:hypothetical protein
MAGREKEQDVSLSGLKIIMFNGGGETFIGIRTPNIATPPPKNEDPLC